MTAVTVHLRDRTARALAARARREGRSLDALLAEIADAAADARPAVSPPGDPLDALTRRLTDAPLRAPADLGRDAIYGADAGG